MLVEPLCLVKRDPQSTRIFWCVNELIRISDLHTLICFLTSFTSKFPDSGLLSHYMRAVSSSVPNSFLITECPALIHIQRVDYTITLLNLCEASMMFL